MTFSPRSRLFAKVIAASLGIVLAGLVTSGCEDKHIGRKCDLNTDDAGTSGSTSAATINSQAVECPSRICLLPAGDKNPPVGPLCTATCGSDDDCEDGETSNAPGRCNSGFVCLVATTVGDFCCQRMCVCKDFVDTTVPGYNKTPPVCEPGTSSCKNVH